MSTSELELKFRIPPSTVDSLRDALLEHGARRTRLQARYFDTPDGLLARHQIALRLRLEGRRWVQTLKTSGEGIAHRLEHEVPVPGMASQTPLLDRHRHDGTAVGQRLDEVLRSAPGAMLVERYATDVVRLSLLLEVPGATRIEAALDMGSVRAGDRSAPIEELELEHKGGPVQGLFALASTWQAHGGLWLCSVTKAERGERLIRLAAEPAIARAEPLHLELDDDGPALLRAMLQSAAAHVLANASEVAEGAVSIDNVHQLRIGLRRLRTLLRELAGMAPVIPAEWHAALSTTFATLGWQRDQEAVAAAVRPLLEAAAAPLVSWRPTRSVDAVAAVRDPAFQSTMIAVLALAHADTDVIAPLPAHAAQALIANRLDELHRQVTRDGRHFESLALGEQHRVRKRLKRLRYLADFTASLWPADKSRRYARRLGDAQDALGRHNDVGVAGAAFRAEAGVRPEAWYAAGYLHAHLTSTALTARKALVKLAKAEKYWSRH